jgi:hypothetical protein
MRRRTVIAVGPPVTRRPPPRSRPAVCSPRALQQYSRPQVGCGREGGLPRLWSSNDPGSGHGDARQYGLVAWPRVTVALATPVEPLPQHPSGAGEERFQAGGVPVDSGGVGRPTKVRVQPLAEHWHPEVASLLAPRGAALPRGAAVRAGRAALAGSWPLAVLAPANLQPQNRDAGCPGESGPTARDEPGLGARPFPSERRSPWPQPVVDGFRLGVVCERAPASVCVSPQTRVASTVPFDHVCNPHIKHVVQAHLGASG